MTKSPRVVDVESTPLSPLQITVPGDDTTPAGHRYTSTYGNDFRQECEWSEKHELQLLHLMATAKPLRQREQIGAKIVTKTIAMVPAETIAVFLQSAPKAEAEADDPSLYFQDDAGYFNVVTDDGRQRRLDAKVGNDRLMWIASNFVKSLWDEEKDAAERTTKLRQRLYAYGGVPADEDDRAEPARYTKAVDARTLPPRPVSQHYEEGDILAPWLTRSYVDVLLKQPWFNDDGDAVLLALRLDVRGEDVNLNDPEVLLNNIRGKEASVPTPLAVKAKQYQALLTAVDEVTGKYKYTPDTLAAELKCSPSTIRNVTYYCEIVDEVRDAVDRNWRGEGGVALSLAVTGRECICYGFDDEDGKRGLLTRAQQQAIWAALLKAFAVESGGDAGISDNAITRAALRKIKRDVLAGTRYEGGGKARKEGRASVAASKAAAERVGVVVDTSALDDMSKSLSRVAKEADEDAEAGNADAKPTKKAKPPVDNYSTTAPKKPASLNIRAALAVKAKQLKAQLEHFNSSARDADEDGLVLAVADAVTAVNEGADAATTLSRFPVLLEALGLLKAETSKIRNKAPSSPFKRQDRVKEIVALAVEAAEAAGDVSTKADVARHVNDVGEGDDAEIVVEAAAMLDAATAGFANTPKAAMLANHIREYLYPAE